MPIATDAPQSPSPSCIRADLNARKFSLPLLVLLALVALVNFLSMPRFVYSGDVMAIKAEAAHLINTGRIGFDYSERDEIGDPMLETKGQYFFQNDVKHTYFSKYGFTYTICYVPVLYLKKLLTGSLGIYDFDPETVFLINCQQVLLSLLYAFYLYRIFTLYNRSAWQSALLVLLAIYPSYVWYYLRSPDKEIVLLVAGSGAIFHSLRFLRADLEGKLARSHLAGALLWAGVTCLLKPLYVLLFATVIAFTARKIIADGKRRRTEGTPPAHHRRLLAVHLGCVAGISAYFMLHNVLRCNSVFVSGYGQDMPFTEEFNLTLDHFLGGLATFFFKGGNGNWFIHQPLLLLAILGYPAFWKSHRQEATFLAAVTFPILAALCLHCEWIGEMCYGPRFSLILILLATIPAGLAFEKIWPAGMIDTPQGKKVARLVAGGLLTALFLLSLRAQIYLNSWHYFTNYNLAATGSPLINQRLDGYLSSLSHRATLYRDLVLWREEQRPFPPRQDLPPLPPDLQADLSRHLELITKTYYWNYMLLPRPAGS